VPRRNRPTCRAVTRWFAVGCAFAVTAAVAGLPAYVYPQTDPLRHADAIFVLGGYGWDRNSFGINLAKEGWAPIVVVSMWNPTRDPARTKVCEFPEPRITKLCFVADPSTTLGEARELRQLASEHGWRTVIAVTFRPHISRARYILEQCYDGELVMVASPADVSPARWIYEYFYQSAGYVRALLHSGC
jgi:uncharacterized SAM-binding protein YcdF (DUF218 family)